MMEKSKSNREMEQKYLKLMLQNNLFAVVYPKDRSEESAKKLVQLIGAATGIVEFVDDNNEPFWGVLIDKVEEAKRLSKKQQEEEKIS